MTPGAAISKPSQGAHHPVMVAKDGKRSDEVLKAPKRCLGCLLCLRAGLWRIPRAKTSGLPLPKPVDRQP
mgnify:CR=1 FL=1